MLIIYITLNFMSIEYILLITINNQCPTNQYTTTFVELLFVKHVLKMWGDLIFVFKITLKVKYSSQKKLYMCMYICISICYNYFNIFI